MNKLFCLLFSILFMCTACSTDSTAVKQDKELMIQAVESADWSLASLIAQRILMEEVNPEIRWQALEVLVHADKQRMDLTWTLPALTKALSEFESEEQQKYIYKELISLYTALNDYEKTIDLIKKCIDLPQTSLAEKTELELKIAQLALAHNDFATAEEQLLVCLEREKTGTFYNQCLFDLSNLYFLLNNIEKVEEYTDLYLALPEATNEDKSWILFIKGDILETQEKYEEALQSFMQAIEYHPNKEVVELRIKNLSNSI